VQTQYEDGVLSIFWTIQDVLKLRPDLTFEQAENALREIEENYTPTCGVNKDTFKFLPSELIEKENE
jgi:hypothetical protein